MHDPETEARRWLRAAGEDLAYARHAAEGGFHAPACFHAQQAAEKAVKGLHLTLGQEAWGHVVARLLRELPIPVDELLVDRARVLDNFYVATRYANGHPEGPPFEHYGKLQSSEALTHAGAIIDFVRAEMARP